jgi:hypothetical protein
MNRSEAFNHPFCRYEFCQNKQNIATAARPKGTDKEDEYMRDQITQWTIA